MVRGSLGWMMDDGVLMSWGWFLFIHLSKLFCVERFFRKQVFRHDVILTRHIGSFRVNRSYAVASLHELQHVCLL